MEQEINIGDFIEFIDSPCSDTHEKSMGRVYEVLDVSSQGNPVVYKDWLSKKIADRELRNQQGVPREICKLLKNSYYDKEKGWEF